MALTRISITLPRDLLAAADKRAKALDRSRSRVLVEALRAYLGGAPRAGAVREPPAQPYTAGLGDQRLAQLRADLALSPEQRVLEGEQSARLGALARSGPGDPCYVVQFARYEDYLTWKRREALGL